MTGAIVDTRSGKIEGFERDGVHVFRGIPYASPPVGPRRWHLPQPEETWEGVRNATEFSAQSAQSAVAADATETTKKSCTKRKKK